MGNWTCSIEPLRGVFHVDPQPSRLCMIVYDCIKSRSLGIISHLCWIRRQHKGEPELSHLRAVQPNGDRPPVLTLFLWLSQVFSDVFQQAPLLARGLPSDTRKANALSQDLMSTEILNGDIHIVDYSIQNRIFQLISGMFGSQSTLSASCGDDK